jgi:hypothetical protein
MAIIDAFIQAELPSVEVLLKSHPDFFDTAITPGEAAALIGSTVAALAQMRTRGGGPPYTRISSHTDSRGYVRGPIRYTRRALIEWLQERVHNNTAGEV